MITLFLGAGASKAFGYPTTKEFIELSDKQFSSNNLYRDITTFLKKRSVFDIEEVLWELDKLLDGFNVIQEDNTFKKWFFFDSEKAIYILQGNSQKFSSAVTTMRGTAKTLKSDVNKLVYDTYWREPAIEVENFYKFFGHLTEESSKKDKKGQIKIFTTNYDLIIERVLEKKREIFSDGFSPDARRAYFWDINHYGDKRIQLYKLHGSIDWKKFDNNEKVCCVPAHDFTKHKDHVILYPGFKGEPNEEPFVSIHNELKTSLLSSGKCIFIGFSFRDEYINKIISEALERNKELQLYIWNPVKPKIDFPDDRIIYFEKEFGINTALISSFRGLLATGNPNILVDVTPDKSTLKL